MSLGMQSNPQLRTTELESGRSKAEDGLTEE